MLSKNRCQTLFQHSSSLHCWPTFTHWSITHFYTSNTVLMIAKLLGCVLWWHGMQRLNTTELLVNIWMTSEVLTQKFWNFLGWVSVLAAKSRAAKQDSSTIFDWPKPKATIREPMTWWTSFMTFLTDLLWPWFGLRSLKHWLLTNFRKWEIKLNLSKMTWRPNA